MLAPWTLLSGKAWIYSAFSGQFSTSHFSNTSVRAFKIVSMGHCKHYTIKKWKYHANRQTDQPWSLAIWNAMWNKWKHCNTFITPQLEYTLLQTFAAIYFLPIHFLPTKLNIIIIIIITIIIIKLIITTTITTIIIIHNNNTQYSNI